MAIQPRRMSEGVVLALAEYRCRNTRDHRVVRRTRVRCVADSDRRCIEELGRAHRRGAADLPLRHLRRRAVLDEKLRLHEVVQKSVDPTTALKVGLKVDADVLPPGILQTVDLKSPATTVALSR